MAKVQNISTISPNIPFTEYNFCDFYRSTFKQTELGRIYELIPFTQLVRDFGLIRHNRHLCGKKNNWHYYRDWDFNKQRLVMPIPQNEINRNNLIKQNPGY